MKAPVIPLQMQKRNDVIDMTPKYPAIKPQSYDYVIIGNQNDVYDVTMKVLEKTMTESVLVILPRLTSDLSNLPLYPTHLALLDSEGESFVNRDVLDWVCLQSMPRRANRTASIFNVNSDTNCYLYKISNTGCQNKSKKLRTLISNLHSGRSVDETSYSYEIASDHFKWIDITERLATPKVKDISNLTSKLNSLRHPRLTVVNDTVIILNYKFNIVGTRRQRFKFNRSVIYTGAVDKMVQSKLSPTSSLALECIKFFPRLPVQKHLALKEIIVDASRLVAQTDVPIWKAMKIPIGSSVYAKERSTTYHIRPTGADTCELVLSDVDHILSKSQLKIEINNLNYMLNSLMSSVASKSVNIVGARMIYAYSRFSAPVMLEEVERERLDALQEPLCLWEGINGQKRKKVFFVLPGICENPWDVIIDAIDEDDDLEGLYYDESSPLAKVKNRK